MGGERREKIKVGMQIVEHEKRDLLLTQPRKTHRSPDKTRNRYGHILIPVARRRDERKACASAVRNDLRSAAYVVTWVSPRLALYAF